MAHPAKQLSTDINSIEEGRKALLTEANALMDLANQLDQSFADAVDLLLSCKGRIIITGMGKSGHIARKIAATLASTGSPATFVHPAEASHGDLGMITKDDHVIALSNSGETSELNNLITFTRRFSIPLIGITSGAESTLARIANVALVLPDAPEACPIGLAPTTSTTLMMAMGDALAVALLSVRGFSSQDFKMFHPGGSLGSALTRVCDKMHTGNRLPLIDASRPMSEVLLVMSEKGFGCVGVTDSNDHLVGVITDGDLRRHMSSNLLAQRAEDIMTSKPFTITGSLLMAEALGLLNEKSITSLFIVEDNKTASKPVGIIHIHDFLRAGVA